MGILPILVIALLVGGIALVIRRRRRVQADERARMVQRRDLHVRQRPEPQTPPPAPAKVEAAPEPEDKVDLPTPSEPEPQPQVPPVAATSAPADPVAKKTPWATNDTSTKPAAAPPPPPAPTPAPAAATPAPAEKKRGGGFLKFIGVCLVIGVGIGVISNLTGASNGIAGGCVKPEQRYNMRDFRNTCNYPVTIGVCTKFGLATLREGLGGRAAEWNCRQAFTQPGRIGHSISWAAPGSSFGAQALGSSNYITGACRSGFTLRMQANEGRYTCQRRQ